MFLITALKYGDQGPLAKKSNGALIQTNNTLVTKLCQSKQRLAPVSNPGDIFLKTKKLYIAKCTVYI